MRRAAALAPILLLLLAAAPTAEAALNGSRPYSAAHPYLDGLRGDEFTMASGELDAVLPGTQGSFGFIDVRGAALEGLTKVCWREAVRRCAAGDLAVHVAAGGSFGVRFPGGADASVRAEHALALFSDLSRTGDLNGLDLGTSLLAPSVGGVVRLSEMAPVPASDVGELSSGGGALAPLDAGTVVEVRDATGGRVLATVRGKADPLTFAGRPVLSPVEAELAVLPFGNAGDVARFRAAGAGAAREGLDLPRVNALLRKLAEADSAGAGDAGRIDEGGLGPLGDAAPALLAGAVLHVPTGGDATQVVSSFAYARTPRLEVRPAVQGGLAWTGQATLDIRDGHVHGGTPLYGWSWLALPWWGWALWVLGLAAFAMRAAMKPEKRHPRWDRFRWVGWVAGFTVAVVVFVLWDAEVRHVVGLSLLSGGLSGQALLLVGLLQVATLGFLSFAAIAPLRLLLRSGSLLLGQGTFMGLAGAVAGLLGYLIGFGTLRSSLDLAIGAALRGVTG
jgi:hypothetical protein